MIYDLIIIGGGAAGFFGAIQCAERNPQMKILILEKSNEVLSKVRVSGGGRCNVTHACFDPSEMVSNYPRGNKELLGPFHRFLCGDMMDWLSRKGVETKIEEDGRVFPASNTSESIIKCFTDLCRQHQIEIKTRCGVSRIEEKEGCWYLETSIETFVCRNVLVASGSSPATWKLCKALGHRIIDPVPSLFTFKIKDPLIDGLAGISVPYAEVVIKDQKFQETGPLLVTHWGLSGPSILKLSAWAARVLHAIDYQFTVEVNWTGKDVDGVLHEIHKFRKTNGKKSLLNHALYKIPKRLWQKMVHVLELEESKFADLKSSQMDALAKIICKCELNVTGKSTFKDEFVTCGGIDTKEINFKTMESKLLPGFYFAGETLNIDAVTGGFNFQAAWTSAYIAADAIASRRAFKDTG
jgi:predicted Rossmann fold flavoprotein